MINPLSIVKETTGGADSAAENKRISVLNSCDNLVITGTKYYISQNGDDSADGKSPETAWKTLEKLTEVHSLLKPGDGVLFERGSVFRQENRVHGELYKNNAVLVANGVTYCAYGSGHKPSFYGSSFNYADESWENCSGNIWKTGLPLQDAGVIVFDEGKYIGIKKPSIEELTETNDFYHDTDAGILYLCSEKGSPDKVYGDIEIGCDRPLFLLCGNVGDAVIDNLDFCYVGGHAISGYEFNRRVRIANCELAWIGGSWQRRDVVRYGNAVQFWDSCSEIVIENCWIHQVYDAGLTFQGGKGAEYKNIAFKDNLIQYCNYCIEFFIQGTQNEEGKYKTTGLLENIDFSGNIMQFAGYGLCEQRPDKFDSANICGWATDVGSDVKGFSIKNNIFDLSARHFIYWIWDEEGDAEISGNTFYERKTPSDNAVKYGKAGQLTVSNRSELENAVKVFDRAPKLVKWLDD